MAANILLEKGKLSTFKMLENVKVFLDGVKYVFFSNSCTILPDRPLVPESIIFEPADLVEEKNIPKVFMIPE